MNNAISYVYVAAIYVALPLAMIWAWIRWARHTQLRTVISYLSLIGFALSTLSALLAIGSMLYAHVIGGFDCYDPRVFTIFQWGMWLSKGAFVFAVAGLWRPSALRWYAPVCVMGTLLFWFMSGLGQTLTTGRC